MSSRDSVSEDVRAAMDDVELLLSSAWPRLTEVEHQMGQRILDGLRPHAAAMDDPREAIAPGDEHYYRTPDSGRTSDG